VYRIGRQPFALVDHIGGTGVARSQREGWGNVAKKIQKMVFFFDTLLSLLILSAVKELIKLA
jgi:hypothetical protein